MHLPFYTAIPLLEIYPKDNTVKKKKKGKLYFIAAQPGLEINQMSNRKLAT